ncbi:hypothetical protein H2O64_18710 [Kordia sp. YSTF-M3]|uniref:Uncharacterized protein n=1 Tax=Kordia aestuariivivens TaxID=2759037 RepID=A0ABR7QDT8_9FLAO|nr:hypothetical protein [Kordia aestuariivivens]MBC8756712.1 hypothetical protein [Kordia aestuariivivens]
MTGNIDVKHHGQIEAGNYLEFNLEDVILVRKIIGVDYFRPPHYLDYDEVKTRHAGLLIECDNDEELIQILDAKSIRQTAIIYKSEK